MKVCKVAAAILAAVMLATNGANAADTPEVATAKRYFEAFKEIASKPGTKSSQFEGFCRLMLENFDVPRVVTYMTTKVIQGKQWSDPAADKAKFIMGYLAITALNRMSFFTEGRPSLNLTFNQQGPTENALFDGLRVKVVKVKARADFDTTAVFITQQNKVVDLEGAMRLSKAAGVELNKTDLWLDKFIGYAIKDAVGDERYMNGCP